MQNQLINEAYLNNLIDLSKQHDEALVGQLFEHLQSEFRSFVRDCGPGLQKLDASGKKELQSRIHRVKNNFFNLGCQEAGSVLEEMYQLLKSETPDREILRQLWDRLISASEMTFSELETTLANHH